MLASPTDLLRAAWQHSVGWLFCAIYVPLMVGIVALHRGDRDRLATPMIRTWGRFLLALCGVELRIEQPRTVMEGGKRVVVINHTSTLDVLVACAIWPRRGAGVLKQEFRALPVLGYASEVLGQVLVDRSSHERAVASLAAAAERMRAEDRCVFIAPEGTRSRDGALGRFKLGAWHLAAAADAPIVPLVFDGPGRLWPRSSYACRRGIVTIRALPAIYPAQLEATEFGASAARLRVRYQRELAAMAATHTTSEHRPNVDKSA